MSQTNKFTLRQRIAFLCQKSRAHSVVLVHFQRHLLSTFSTLPLLLPYSLEWINHSKSEITSLFLPATAKGWMSPEPNTLPNDNVIWDPFHQNFYCAALTFLVLSSTVVSTGVFLLFLLLFLLLHHPSPMSSPSLLIWHQLDTECVVHVMSAVVQQAQQQTNAAAALLCVPVLLVLLSDSGLTTTDHHHHHHPPPFCSSA